MPHYSRSILMLDASTSTTTSASHLVADYRQLSLSIETSTTSSSRFTVWGAAADGLQSALRAGDFSVVTAIVGAGAFTIDPGLRWLKVERDAFNVSALSNATIILHGVVAG